jgi:TonB-linked SusC/RagA family outer membrane protein
MYKTFTMWERCTHFPHQPALKLVMRIGLFYLISTAFCTQLLMASGSEAQSLTSIEVSLELKNESLRNLFHKIEEQTELRFAFMENQVESRQRLNLMMGKYQVAEVLNRMLIPMGLTHMNSGNIVYIIRQSSGLKEKKALGSAINEEPQSTYHDLRAIRVKGTVTDEKGDALPGVSILVKGSNYGMTSDQNGSFSIEVPDKQAILVFSFVGYETQEVVAGVKDELNITLKIDEKALAEVVVVGFGTQKKINLTGAVDVISDKQIQNRQSPTISQLLQGQSPGLSFSTDGHGFRPGAEMAINIRGIGSLNGGAPFVLIDGIPGDMNRLNPQDVESVSVLKDAAASAIYGARAPYGVILITTKSGGKDEKISVTYSGNVTSATPQRLPKMPDSYTYARVMNEAGVNGGGRVHTNEVVDRIIAFQNQDWNFLKKLTVPNATHFETVPLANGTWGLNQNSHANYDWFKEYYGRGLNHQHNLSVRGGTKSTSYYFSAGYFDQEGVLKYGTDTFDRINLMGKIKTSIASWWDFTYQPRLMKSSRISPNPQAGEDYSIIFHQIARTRPNSAKYDGYGNIMVASSKIPWINDAGTRNYELTENMHNFSTVLRPLSGWSVNMDLAYRGVDAFGSDRQLTVFDYMVNKTPVPDGQTTPSWVEQSHLSANYWTTNLYSTYTFDIAKKHNFVALAGYQAESNLERSLSVRKNTLLVQDVTSLQTAIGSPIANEDLSHWSTQGYFARLTYDFKEKYLLELNLRRDGTSRFRKEKRWGTFPSISAGWNIHSEQFWEPLEKVINSFKIRGSWGELGNQNVAPYQDLNLIPLIANPLNWIYTYGQSRPIGYTGTPSLVSPYLTWESARSKNLGIDMSFLSERLRTSFDFFERKTSNMIGPAEAQPGVLGASLPWANNSTLRTRGWEWSLKWQQQLQPGFSYFINANLYDARTFVTKYLNPTGLLSSWYAGKEQGEIWGYTSNDLYRTQEEVASHQSTVNLSAIWGGAWRSGDVKYEDLNGDGKVNRASNTVNDHGDLSIIGNSTPRYQYGISAGVTIRGFDLSILFKGTAKRDLFFNADENIFWGFRSTATQSSPFTNHLDYFRDKDGDKYTGLYEGAANQNLNAYLPRPYLNGEDVKNKETSTRYLQSGAYLRLQNIQLGYNLESALLKKMKLQKVRFYVAGENLVTFTSLPNGIDPLAVVSTWGVGKTYGADRMLSLGLTMTY